MIPREASSSLVPAVRLMGVSCTVVVRLVAVTTTVVSSCAGAGLAPAGSAAGGPSFRGGAPSPAYTVNGDRTIPKAAARSRALEFFDSVPTFMYLPRGGPDLNGRG